MKRLLADLAWGAVVAYVGYSLTRPKWELDPDDAFYSAFGRAYIGALSNGSSVTVPIVK